MLLNLGGQKEFLQEYIRIGPAEANGYHIVKFWYTEVLKDGVYMSIEMFLRARNARSGAPWITT